MSVDPASAAALLASAFVRRQGMLRTFHRADATLLMRLSDGSLADPVRRTLAGLVLRCEKPLAEADLLARKPRVPHENQTAIFLKRGPDDRRPSHVASADDTFVDALTRANGRAEGLGLRFAADLRGFAEGRVPWAHIDRASCSTVPPGVGKTSFASALARSAGVRFRSGSYSELQRHGRLSDFLAAMQKTFDTARRSMPAYC